MKLEVVLLVTATILHVVMDHQVSTATHDLSNQFKINKSINDNIKTFIQKRQAPTRRFRNSFGELDDWYVFDEVEGDQNLDTVRLTTTTQRTTPKMQIPNAIGPRPSQCQQICFSRTTSQYNPICGDDAVTYFNDARMQCARTCGKSVRMLHMGTCRPLLPFK